MQERDHRAIDTQHELFGSGRRERMGLQDAFGLTGLESDSGCSSCLTNARSSGTMDLDLREEGKLARCFGEGGNMAAEPHQALLQARREFAAQQGQFLIEGGKARSHIWGRHHSYVRGSVLGRRG